MKVVFSTAARSALAEIGDYIRPDNPRRADTFTAELVRFCQSIGEMPLTGAALPVPGRSGLRRRVHGRYIIVYRVQANTVEIVRIVHGARDLKRLLAGDDSP